MSRVSEKTEILFFEFDKPEEDIAFSDVDWCVRRDRFWCAVGFRYICVRL